MAFLFTVSGPSGVGKTTLIQSLPQEINSVTLSISTTSRAKRIHEVDKNDYYFVTTEQFESKIKAGDFIEWTKVNQAYYGTDRLALEQQLNLYHAILLNIDSYGAKNLKKLFPKQTITLFIEPPDIQALEDRLMRRGTESTEQVQRRIQHGKQELAQKGWFDYCIVNQDLKTAQETIKKIIRHHLQINAATPHEL